MKWGGWVVGQAMANASFALKVKNHDGLKVRAGSSIDSECLP
jgi:hypothetical protein